MRLARDIRLGYLQRFGSISIRVGHAAILVFAMQPPHAGFSAYHPGLVGGKACLVLVPVPCIFSGVFGESRAGAISKSDPAFRAWVMRKRGKRAIELVAHND